MIKDLEGEVLNHYLKRKDDIRSCPRNECNYFGFIEFNRCSEQLMCEVCNFQWGDPVHKGFSYSEQYLSYLHKILFEEPCPNCGVFI